MPNRGFSKCFDFPHLEYSFSAHELSEPFGICVYIIIDDYGDALENSERSSEKLFYPALFVQQIKDAQFRFDKIDTGLIVIEVYESPFDLLPKIFLLLQLEHVLIKLLLQLLVRVIYTELFERIDLERLETVNIENTDETLGFVLGLEGIIDTGYDPVEQFRVDMLGQCVSGTDRLFHVHRFQKHFPHRHDFSMAQPFPHRVYIGAQ